MRRTRIGALAASLGLAAAIVSAVGFRKADLKVGDVAPDFSAVGIDGKTQTLKSLSEKGPVVLYFIKIGCPVNHRAAPHFDKLARAYEGKATMVGIINGNAVEAKAWLKNYKSDLTILSDPDLKIIRAYGAAYSPWAVGIENGKVAQIWEGGSSKELAGINTVMAKAAKMPEAKLDFAGAPSGGG